MSPQMKLTLRMSKKNMLRGVDVAPGMVVFVAAEMAEPFAVMGL